MVGGDLNLEEAAVDAKIINSGLERIKCEEGQCAFRSDIGGEHRGKIIEHIMAKGYACRATVSKMEGGGELVNLHSSRITTLTGNLVLW